MLNKRSIYWSCQIIAWSLYGVLEIVLYYSADQLDAAKVIGELFIIGFYILSSHTLREIILRTGLLKYRWFVVIPRVLFFITLMAIINYFFLMTVSYAIGNLNLSRELNLLSFIVNTSISIVLYFVWALAYLSFLYIERFNKSLQYQAAATETELNNLKAQLNPHFIFNALNSIRALVDEDPVKSKNAITQLSHILRKSLSMDHKKLVPFEDEMNTVMDYLQLESIRYEERLSTKISLDPRSNRFQIPPLMMQTLVENGIKHGISNLKEGGVIDICTTVVEERLKIEIRNSGQFSNGGLRLDVGYGLLSTKKRLSLIYGDEASFRISNEDECTVLTAIEIPEGQGSLAPL